MIKVILSLVCLFSWYLPTYSQAACAGTGKVVPYPVRIAGKTDSITVEDMLRVGKVESSNLAFKVSGFRFGFFNPLGCYSELPCSGDSLPVAIISKLTPGFRIFIDCVWATNQAGQTYLLTSSQYRIARKPVTR